MSAEEALRGLARRLRVVDDDDLEAEVPSVHRHVRQKAFRVLVEQGALFYRRTGGFTSAVYDGDAF